MKTYKKFTKKQNEVLNDYKTLKPRVTIFHGAKRSGKTFLMNFLFLAHISKYANQGKSFILGGSTSGAVQRNVLDDWEKILGQELKKTKGNYIWVFGNKVHIFGGEDKSAYKKARGFTSYGTYLNELTTLHQTFVEECFSRTSGQGARIYADTNTDAPTHFVKTNYIDKAWQKLPSGNLDIMEVGWTLYDNTSLSEDYVASIENATPTGASYDRHILGKWVTADGVVYKDFDNNNLKPLEEFKNNIEYYILGVDWGYEHYGSISLIGVSHKTKCFYLVDYIAKKHEYIEWWEKRTQELVEKYNIKYIFCDSARPEHTDRFKSKFGEKVVKNANKSVDEGIDFVGTLFKQNRLIINDIIYHENAAGVNYDLKNGRLKKELNEYVYGTDGKPIKENDDVLDGIRYAVFSYVTLPAQPKKAVFKRSI